MPGRLMELTDEMIEIFEIDTHDGYLSPFSRQQYPSAKYANGTRVIKLWEDAAGDLTKPGETGVILGSIGHPMLDGALYFVEWDSRPRIPTALIESKIAVTKADA